MSGLVMPRSHRPWPRSRRRERRSIGSRHSKRNRRIRRRPITELPGDRPRDASQPVLYSPGMSRTITRPDPAVTGPERQRIAVPTWVTLTALAVAVGGALGLAVVAVSPIYVVGGL